MLLYVNKFKYIRWKNIIVNNNNKLFKSLNSDNKPSRHFNKYIKDIF